MEDLDLPALTKLKMALVSPHRIIGVNVGLGHRGETDPAGDWKELRKSDPGTDDYALSMFLEPMYLLVGRRVPSEDTSYDFEACDEQTRPPQSSLRGPDGRRGRLVVRRVRGDRASREDRRSRIQDLQQVVGLVA